MVMTGSVTGNIYLRNSGGNVTSAANFTKIANVPPTAQYGNKLVGTGWATPAQQGYSVSVSADGNTAIVGGNIDNYHKGAAWVYTRIGGIWSQQGSKLVGTGDPYCLRGTSVAISADGNTAIEGGDYDTNSGSNGSARIFTRSGGVWNQQGGKLYPPGNFPDRFGVSVSLSADGNTAIVGSSYYDQEHGRAYIYTRSNGVWTQQGILNGQGSGPLAFGYSVSLSADGNTAIVGEYKGNNEQGAAWIYTRSAGVWSSSSNGIKLVGTGNIGAARQGYSVSISADGNTAIIGGTYDNSNKGAVWIFTKNGAGVWSQQGNKLVGTSNASGGTQGSSVSLSADGNTAIVGGESASSVWIYKRNGSTWTQIGNKLVGTGEVGFSHQGHSVSISADGNTSIVGGYTDSLSTGAVWVYNGALSTNANLSNIALNSGTLSPVFDSTIIAYTVNVSNLTTSITVNPTKVDTNATIQIRINGGTYTTINNGSISNPLLLKVGSNTININVTAKDGVTIKTYTITVYRSPSINAKLSNINLLGTTYNPIFNSDTLTYSASVLFGINKIYVTSTLADTTARIKIKINGDTFTNINNNIASASLALNIGSNTIYIKVTAQDTSVTTIYSININRANAIAPYNMSYLPNSIVANRTVTFVFASISYSGDSIKTFKISPALPNGLNIDTTTGTISGIPLIISPLTTYTITGTNLGGSNSTTLILTINSMAPSALSYSTNNIVTTKAVNSINSTPSYSGDSITKYKISPALPYGVKLDSITGKISGTPLAISPLTNYTITGTNSGGSTTTLFTLTVKAIAPSALNYSPNAIVTKRTITNINATPTYLGDSITKYKISPALPNGVKLDSTSGNISGIPLVISPLTTYTITGTNSGGSTIGSFTLTVINVIAPSAMSYIPSTIIATRTITNINSIPFYSGDTITKYRITPALPNGVKLDSITGKISGIPLAISPLTNYTITGTNSIGSTTGTFTLSVDNAIAPRSMNYTPDFVVATNRLTNVNSSPSYFGDSITKFIVATPLPMGVKLDSITGKISGIPLVTLAQTVFTITGSNTGGSTSATFTLTVNDTASSISEINSNSFSNLTFKPNPFTNQIELNYVSETKSERKLLVTDAMGREVLNKTLASNMGENTFSLVEMSTLKAGVYFAYLQSDDGYSKAIKLIKE